MDFQQLLAKMNELSQPAPASTAVAEQPVAECPPAMGPGEPMGDMGGMDKPDAPPPSMSLNLNAQGMDNIEQLMALIKAVNPDLDKPAAGIAAPAIEIEPMDQPAGGLPPLGGLGNLDSGPLKMLPDLDADNDNMPGGEIDSIPGGDDVTKAQGDVDNDGDHDMDDHEMEKDSEEDEPEEEGAYGNSAGDSEPETYGVDAAIPNGNDLNKEKQQFRRAQPGDNPMAMEGEELRAWIKSELTQRLAEAKGAK